MELASLPYLILDGQTTGLSARNAELIELGWSLWSDADCIETRLIRPTNAESVPKKVWKMTGLSPADFEDGAKATDLWKSIVEGPAAACGFAVIHYSQFEVPFLRHLHRSVYGQESELPWKVLCTYQIAKKLHPELPARSLRALSGHFGYVLPEEHRAKGHVAATQKIWKSLLRDLGEGEKVHTYEDLYAWLRNRPAKTKPVARKYLVERDKRLTLCEGPGIYEMLSAQGKILYIGKATSLRSRVNSYFRQRKTTRTRLKELMTQVADVRVTPTESALEAALLENDKIKLVDPPYNYSLRQQERRLLYFSSALQAFSEATDSEYSWGPFLSEHPFESLELLWRVLRDEAHLILPLYLNFPAEEMKPVLQELLSRVGWAEGHEWTVSDLFQAAKKLRLRPNEENNVQASVERKLARPVRSLHYARWICWLMECRVSWERSVEGKTLRRVLVVQWGQIHQAYDTEKPLEPFARERCNLRSRRERLDVATYDRVRILATELGIMAKKGTDIQIDFSPTRTLRRGTLLARLLGEAE